MKYLFVLCGLIVGSASANTVIKSDDLIDGAVVRPGTSVKGLPELHEITFIDAGEVVRGGDASDSASLITAGRLEPVVKVESVRTDIKDIKNWCSFRADDEFYIEDVERGYFGFVINKGSLDENVKRFVNSFFPDNQGLIDRVGEHKVVGQMCLIERSTDLIIQKLIAPFEVDKRGINYGDFQNGIHALFYQMRLNGKLTLNLRMENTKLVLGLIILLHIKKDKTH